MLAGTFRDPLGTRRPAANAPIVGAGVLYPPTFVDLSPNWVPINDQSWASSCTWNAWCEAVEYLQRKGRACRFLSRMFGWKVTRNREGTGMEDTGCSLPDCVDVFEQVGTCLETTWPYDLRNIAVEPPPEAYTEAAQHKLQLSFACPDETSIKWALAQDFPVVIGFDVPKNAELAYAVQTGEISVPFPGETMLGGHAVVIVGYDDSKKIGSSVGCWKIANSWGTAWGDSGFGYLPYEFNRLGLLYDAITPRRGGF